MVEDAHGTVTVTRMIEPVEPGQSFPVHSVHAKGASGFAGQELAHERVNPANNPITTTISSPTSSGAVCRYPPSGQALDLLPTPTSEHQPQRRCRRNPAHPNVLSIGLRKVTDHPTGPAPNGGR